MTSWPSKSTLQRLLDLAGLYYTTLEWSGPFWQSMLHNFLPRPLSFLGWTTTMHFWLDFHQTQSNLYKIAARIKFETLMLAYRTTTGSAPTYFHSLLRIYIPSRSPAYFHSLLRTYIPSRSLRSASERRLVVPSQRGSKSLSRTFSFTVPGWWNDLPTPTRTHCTNTTTYLLPLDTTQCTSMTLHIQIMYNLLHLRILLCVYMCTKCRMCTYSV